MALTVAPVGNIASMGNMKAVVADITFDSSYPTGGEDLTAETLGMTNIRFVVADGASGYNIVYDYANAKLKAFGSTAGTEVANATNLATVSCRIIAIG